MGAWWAAVYGVAQSQTRVKRLSSSSTVWHLYLETILVEGTVLTCFFWGGAVFTSFIYCILTTELVLNKLCWINDYIKNLVLHESESVSCSVVSDSYDFVDCGPPGSSVHGIFQTSILEWVFIPFCRGFSWPRDQTRVSWVKGRFFAIWATGKPYTEIISTKMVNYPQTHQLQR